MSRAPHKQRSRTALATRRSSRAPAARDSSGVQALAPFPEEQLKELCRVLAPTDEMRQQNAVLETARELRECGVDPLRVLIAAKLVIDFRGVDPVAILLAAVKRRKGKPRGRRDPRMDKALEQAATDFLGRYSEAEISDKKQLREGRRFIVERLISHAQTEGVPTDNPGVRDLRRWLALDSVRESRRTTGSRMPTRYETIEVSGEEKPPSVQSIEKSVRRLPEILRQIIGAFRFR